MYANKLIEAVQKPGLLGTLGAAREKSCRQDVAAYFKLMAEKLPIQQLSQLANTEHKQAALHSAEVTIRNVLRKMRPALVGVLATHMMLAWKHSYITTTAGTATVKEAETSGSPMDHLGDYGQRAADFAATSSAEMVKGIDQTTLDLLQDVISEGIEEKLGVDGLARLIRSSVLDMSRDRARMIATTEMNRAMSNAALEKLDDLGVEYKQWIAVDDPCDDCAGNEDDGPIPVDESFSSGDDAPPAHPNCRCAVTGARAPES